MEKIGELYTKEDWAKDIKAILGQDHVALVATVNGEIVAFSLASYGSGEGDINLIAVREGYRRKGVGRTLLEEIMKLLEFKGVKKINLDIPFFNREAQGFVESFGFTPRLIEFSLDLTGK